jgi:hypothetical protein
MPDEKPDDTEKPPADAPAGATAAVLLAKIEELKQDNARVRRRNRELRDAQPPEGTVAVSPDRMKKLEAFEALALEPEAIKAGLAERDAIKGEQHIAKAAESVGWRAGVLGTLAKAQGLRIDFRDAEVQTEKGKETKSLPHIITGEGDAAKAEPLTAYVERLHGEFLPALKAEAAPAHRGKAVSPYPQQTRDGDTKKGLTVEEEKERRRSMGAVPAI